ncbi:non-classical arabinogalactan protein 30 [Telopea speciosissima]|uniref:non-classical arabinogalactan protein 30 n=1 Tax=Telopea speciosissima TaxID=54955 RepID=UPI001CC3B8CF|nr:non-classical arabinogalactan protein 30 [Telopea speciosissima]
MGFSSLKTFAVLQLLLLLLGSVAKAHSPAPSPSPSPSHPPSDRPSNHPPSKPVDIQGMVYCKSCKYSGHDSLSEATPISGAVVKLKCHNTKHAKNVVAKTDEGGYFYLQAPHTVATYGAYKCKVSLLSSSSSSPCQLKTNINNGTTGDALRYEEQSSKTSYALYTVGPFAFEPPKC